MKEYSHEKKKWVEVENPKTKKRDTCKGGREHEYLLTVPSHAYTPDMKPEAIEEYYASEQRTRYFEDAEYAKLTALGLNVQKSWRHGGFKYYICETCGKKKYK